METRETITMDARAQQRLYVLTHVIATELTAEEAGRILQLSTRQVRRLLSRYRRAGPAALVHGNRGRPPVHRTPEGVRARLVQLATTTYAGVNRAHLTELLAEREKTVVAARTLRRILAEAGVAAVRSRRSPRHRSRRERVARVGLLLQVDGSRHDWLEGRGPWLTLVGAIDDATGLVTGAIFRAQEDAAGYLDVLSQTVRRHGLPVALYSDRHGIFWRDRQRPPTLAEQLTGKRTLTQVGRALEEAGIGWIAARSPQAKGRVERLWGTLQDRLSSELRLASAATLAEANTVLARYLPRHNARFTVPAAEPLPAWRRLSEGQRAEAVFAFHYPRRVANDATVSWGSGDLALPRRRDGRGWAGCAVVVQERLDGSLWVSHGGHDYRLQAAPPGAVTLRARQLSTKSAGKGDLPSGPASQAARPIATSPRTPAADHPWRRYPAVQHR